MPTMLTLPTVFAGIRVVNKHGQELAVELSHARELLLNLLLCATSKAACFTIVESHTRANLPDAVEEEEEGGCAVGYLCALLAVLTVSGGKGVAHVPPLLLNQLLKPAHTHTHTNQSAQSYSCQQAHRCGHKCVCACLVQSFTHTRDMCESVDRG